jgi:cytochrome c553
MLNTGFPPLWNRKINTNNNYTTYDAAGSPHFEATSSSSLNGQVKGVSLACLSCHDGTIAFDALINLQGSGGYVLANASQGVGPGDHALADTLFGMFSGEAVDPDHTFREGDRANDPAGFPFGGSVFDNDTLEGSGGAAPFPNLTQDLRDDHPISFQIPSAADDPQFSEMIAASVADGNGKLLYLARAVGTSRYPADKRDRLRAYTSIGGVVASGSTTNAYIECASCHNPHTPRTLFLRLPSGVDDAGAFNSAGTALRSGGGDEQAPAAVGLSATYWSHAPNQASAICISCHQK